MFLNLVGGEKKKIKSKNISYNKVGDVERDPRPDGLEVFLHPVPPLSPSEEAPDGYCSTLPMLPTLCDSHDPAPLPSDYCCHGGENRARHHVGPVPVGGHRGQVSACAAFFFDSAPVGHPVLGVLSAPGVSSRRYLPAGRR